MVCLGHWSDFTVTSSMHTAEAASKGPGALPRQVCYSS